ncbi:MAG: S41 family peptidase [Spirosomaceae bacterium]|nr:S41 family peptidase [Spirosomataceae bacterium]
MVLKSKIGILVAAVLLSVASCKKDDVDPNSGTNTNTTNPVAVANPNKEVNDWIYEQMKTYYLWADNIPADKTKTKQTLDPMGKNADGYFYSLLNDYPNTDRFSWIQQSSTELVNSLNGINKSTGIRYSIFFIDSQQKNLGFFVNYTIKGSPAERVGIKRGDIILTVNGTQLTVDNYTSALANDNLTLGFGMRDGSNIVSNGKTISLTKEEVTENPVHFSTVINKDNKKIGYLVYTQFISNNDNDLRNVFADFKAKGVNELILDLRFNGGGFISSAVVLSSLIGKGVNSTKVMYTDEWNNLVTTEFKKRFGENYFTKNFRDEPNAIGNNLSRVFVLTSRSSASASELVINSLKPYMDVVLIGGNTFGKNVGSITISDDKKRWTYGMQPIVLRTVNALGKSEYGTRSGFTPDYPVTDNVVPFKPFGDEQETLLNKALSIITGKPVVMSVPNGRQSAPIRLERQVSINRADNPRMEISDMFAEPLK